MSRCKLMKRMVITLLIGMLTSVCVSAGTVEDKIEPTINSVDIEFNKEKLGVDIVVEASDEGSGLADVAIVSYIAENNKNSNVKLKLMNDKYIGFLPITNKTESMSISFIAIGDNNKNVSIQYNRNVHNVLGNDLSGGDIDSSLFVTDKISPTLNAVNVEVDYNTIEVTIDATDYDSGLFKEAYAIYNIENGSYQYEKKLTLNLEEGKYIGTMNTAEVEGSGKLSYIALVDRYNNTMIAYNSKVHEILGQDLSQGNFNTKVLANDTIAPVFKSIEVEVDEDIAYISVQAKDALSGLSEEAIASYVFESEIDGELKKEERVVLLKLENETYIGQVDLKNMPSMGRLSYLTLWDTKKNVKIVYNSQVHEVLGINTSFADIAKYGTKINVENITEEERFYLGEDAEINIKLTNSTSENRKITAKFVLYDINNTMVQCKENSIEIGSLKSKNAKEVLSIPEEGYYKIKVILLDSQSGKAICDPIDIDVQ